MKKRPVFTKEWLKTTACAGLNPDIDEQLSKKPPITLPVPQKGQKTKAWIDLLLKVFAAANGLVVKKELRFDKDGRKWRSDWSLFRGVTLEQIEAGDWKEENQVALIELEGIGSERSRHTERKGYEADAAKYTEASLLGWVLLRYSYATSSRLATDLGKLKL